jgi:UDP-glucose 4-epimerase
MKNKKILITGAKGFLGSNVSKYFKSLGSYTYGIGHGEMSVDECKKNGLDDWHNSDITLESIKAIKISFDLIIHCGGSGSVGFSVEHPYKDFRKTVDGTLEVLEYMRLYNKDAYLVYPSSPAVQGGCANIKIKENYHGNPVSPYGYHKKIAEELCRSYSEKYKLKVGIIRLFSVYGEGLKKQLLWDACQKIGKAQKYAVFWGSGNETRDFIHVNDVVIIMKTLFSLNKSFIIVNGGTGKKYTINKIVTMIRDRLSPDLIVKFNGQINIGDPLYYWADTEVMQDLLKHDYIDFKDGVFEYVKWCNDERK